MKYGWALSLLMPAVMLAACSGGDGGSRGGSGFSTQNSIHVGGNYDDDDAAYENIEDSDLVGDPAEWTYMVYMGADNNLSLAGLIDMDEMERAGSNQNVNVVLQAEFSTFFTDFDEFGHSSYIGDTRRFRIRKDYVLGEVSLDRGESKGFLNMADPAALTSFIKWAASTYPAKRYALVIWDHGAGWKASEFLKGAVEDGESFMSLPEIAKGVRDAGVPLDVINFDACLMAMYEVAYEFRGLSDYMVFSEETEPGAGDPYDAILKRLHQNPQMDARTLSGTIVDEYAASYNNNRRVEKITKSAVDMSKIDDLHAAVVNLAGAIVDKYDLISGTVGAARANSQSYEYPTNLDLYDFAKQLDNRLPGSETTLKNNAAAVTAAVASAAIWNKTLDDAVKNSHGLAIYIPGSNQVSYNQMQDDLADYAKLACNQAENRLSASWINVVEKLTADSDPTTLVDGGFSFHIKWDTDADVDLNVCEPDMCYAPWSGQTTPNGYFSGDSFDTGYSEEYYSANDYVKPGPYDVFVEYWEDGKIYNYANISFSIYDPDPVDGTNGEWLKLDPVRLDLSDPGDFDEITSAFGFVGLNLYTSNFWYPWWLDRARPQEGAVEINIGSRPIRLFTRKRKKTRLNIDGKR